MLDLLLIIKESNILIVLVILVLLVSIHISSLLTQKLEASLNKNIEWAKSPRRIKKTTQYLKIKKISMNIKKIGALERYIGKANHTMKRAGENRKFACAIYLFFRDMLPITFAGFLFIQREFNLMIYVFIFRLIVNFYVYQEIKKQANLFKKDAYMLYSFLNNQISSGVKQTDAIKNLHKVTNDKKLKERLKLMAATYIVTTNIDESLKYITDYYYTQEARSMAVAIKLGVDTGNNSTTLEKKEENMLNQFMDMVKFETEKLKYKYLMIGIIIGIPLIIFISYPLVIDLLQAEKQIFMNN
ncbi:type II secretion system (T2SS) protein F [Natranaerovirga pectinivora]|uniref:Type II secretion system (T2SS) protein F n=1 Tax=Natranaerovirga pectinivora TaxID=682400 RepID=A0A4R3MTJ1_9FIRM|nr:type II secretion system F family protein [Natranaerovirga pectinivora]TCT17030.1 type II secretion system (T2SS) protein F [Natranaerovirga pectinivora]